MIPAATILDSWAGRANPPPVSNTLHPADGDLSDALANLGVDANGVGITGESGCFDIAKWRCMSVEVTVYWFWFLSFGCHKKERHAGRNRARSRNWVHVCLSGVLGFFNLKSSNN